MHVLQEIGRGLWNAVEMFWESGGRLCSVVEGRIVYFCGASCKAKFEAARSS